MTDEMQEETDVAVDGLDAAEAAEQETEGAVDDATATEDKAAEATAESELADSATDDDVIELEVSEEDIVRYLVDEDGNEIGFVIMEDGEEAEYLYAEDPAPADEPAAHHAAGDGEYDLGITREGVANATNDMNAIYKDGIMVAAELKGAFDDIKGALDFGSLLK